MYGLKHQDTGRWMMYDSYNRWNQPRLYKTEGRARAALKLMLRARWSGRARELTGQNFKELENLVESAICMDKAESMVLYNKWMQVGAANPYNMINPEIVAARQEYYKFQTMYQNEYNRLFLDKTKIFCVWEVAEYDK